VHAQKLGGQSVFLAGRVSERQGFRGFVQFDVGGNHEKQPLAASYKMQA
jgi:hypothetical protein